MHYYGTRLSENISRREPEGYLLCMNVPVARTGTQEYLPEELGLGAAGPPGLIPVLRPETEVFSPETVASFEGMPVTDGHPPDGVDVSNIRALQKGHAHNVRRGAGGESDLLLADLIITDPVLIDEILTGNRREISCGYTYELSEENGRYVQRRIRGNHVAVVDAGRAGPRVCIKDHEPPLPAYARGSRRPGTTERRAHTMKKSLSRILARMAKDGDVETVAEILEEMIDPGEMLPGTAPETDGTGDVPAEENAEAPGTQNIIIDEEGLAGICERLDVIIALLQPAAADGAEELAGAIGEAVESAVLGSADPAAEEISAVMEELLDPVLSAASDPAEDEEECLPETLQTGDALRAALSAVRPVLAGMPKHLRRRAAADIAARLRRTAGRKASDAGVYAALRSAGRRPAAGSADLGRRIMEKRNPHFKTTRG